MWKAIGSVHSGDDRSIRSNRSREEVSFEHFHQHPANRSALEPKADRSFCFDYFQKKREGKSTLEKSRAKSQKNLRGQEAKKEDMFTSMRNVLGKDEISDSRMISKNQDPEAAKPSQRSEQKNDQIYKQAIGRIRNLKKEQNKLKSTLSNEFTTFKNMFLQLEDVMHIYENRLVESQEEKPVKATSELQLDFVKDIVSEAMSIEKYFMEMERKKAGIMSQLSHK